MRTFSPRIFAWLLAAVGAHSLALGLVLLWRPLVVLDRLGWTFEESRFFPAQSGIFLIVLAVFYFAAIWHRPFAWTVVVSKFLALAFLLGESLAGNCPRIVFWLAWVDGSMGLLVLLHLLGARRAR